MGRINSEFRALYWLSRFMNTLPSDPPPKEIEAKDLTREQLIARYAHRVYFLMTGEKFDKKAFADMMRPYEPPQK